MGGALLVGKSGSQEVVGREVVGRKSESPMAAGCFPPLWDLGARVEGVVGREVESRKS